MALPKRKHSHSRTRKRRTHQKLNAPNLVKCPSCGNYILSHRVCPYCGYYKAKKVIEVSKPKKK